MKKLLTYLLPIFLLTGCASWARFHASVVPSPSLEILRDEYYKTTTVLQRPVIAYDLEGSDVMGNYLGFFWEQKNPDKIYIMAARQNTQNIEGVSFKLEDLEIIGKNCGMEFTDYGVGDRELSIKYFEISFSDFKKIAYADFVKYKIDDINTYSVSTFGRKIAGCVLNLKFDPFLQKISRYKSN